MYLIGNLISHNFSANTFFSNSSWFRGKSETLQKNMHSLYKIHAVLHLRGITSRSVASIKNCCFKTADFDFCQTSIRRALGTDVHFFWFRLGGPEPDPGSDDFLGRPGPFGSYAGYASECTINYCVIFNIPSPEK